MIIELPPGMVEVLEMTEENPWVAPGLELFYRKVGELVVMENQRNASCTIVRKTIGDVCDSS